MLIDKIVLDNGTTLVNVPADRQSLSDLGLPAQEIDRLMAEADAQQDGLIKLRKLRASIDQTAGDQASLLGTTSDAATLAIYGLASLVAKLSTANSLAEVREAATPFADLSADFLAKIEKGEIKLPFFIKGIESVVADIETRSTAVSDVIINFRSDS